MKGKLNKNLNNYAKCPNCFEKRFAEIHNGKTPQEVAAEADRLYKRRDASKILGIIMTVLGWTVILVLAFVFMKMGVRPWFIAVIIFALLTMYGTFVVRPLVEFDKRRLDAARAAGGEEAKAYISAVQWVLKDLRVWMPTQDLMAFGFGQFQNAAELRMKWYHAEFLKARDKFAAAPNEISDEEDRLLDKDQEEKRQSAIEAFKRYHLLHLVEGRLAKWIN